MYVHNKIAHCSAVTVKTLMAACKHVRTTILKKSSGLEPQNHYIKEVIHFCSKNRQYYILIRGILS